MISGVNVAQVLDPGMGKLAARPGREDSEKRVSRSRGEGGGKPRKIHRRSQGVVYIKGPGGGGWGEGNRTIREEARLRSES